MGLLDGRFAAITGAAGPRGLGRAMAQMFADHGATVAILDLNADQAQAVAAELGPNHVGLACDVTDKAACDAALSDLIGRWGRIDSAHGSRRARGGSPRRDHSGDRR